MGHTKSTVERISGRYNTDKQHFIIESYSQDCQGEAEETVPDNISANTLKASSDTIETFFDKKRNFLEKNLFTHKRDQNFLEVALGD